MGAADGSIIAVIMTTQAATKATRPATSKICRASAPMASGMAPFGMTAIEVAWETTPTHAAIVNANSSAAVSKLNRSDSRVLRNTSGSDQHPGSGQFSGPIMAAALSKSGSVAQVTTTVYVART